MCISSADQPQLWCELWTGKYKLNTESIVEHIILTEI